MKKKCKLNKETLGTNELQKRYNILNVYSGVKKGCDLVAQNAKTSTI